MAEWAHDAGFSVDAQVRIEAHDRAGLERLLRYCARPAFALERLREIDAEHLVYESVKPGPGGSVSLVLTPLELLDRLAALERVAEAAREGSVRHHPNDYDRACPLCAALAALDEVKP